MAAIPSEGVSIKGEITARELDIEDDDRIGYPDSISYRFELSLVSDGLLARGRMKFRTRCRCDRCLVYFNRHENLSELCYFIAAQKDDIVDLTDPVRQDILLSFPQQLHCKQDCRGLCGQCGQNLNVRQCECIVSSESNAVWGDLDRLDLGSDKQS